MDCDWDIRVSCPFCQVAVWFVPLLTRAPRPGDFAVCDRCDATGVYTSIRGELVVRQPTDVESVELAELVA